jgi:hypothetical protein
MEELAEVEDKGSLKTEAYELLHALQDKHSPGSTTFYVRRSDYADKRFLELDLEKLGFLESEGIGKMSDYIRQGTPDLNVIAFNLLPKGQECLKSRTTVTTQTITEVFQEPEEPVWKANKRSRNFARTERGFGIVTSSPEGLASNIRGHISALQHGGITRAEWKSRQIWLMYSLLYRYDEIPEQLRHEAEDYRDLPFTGRRKHD